MVREAEARGGGFCGSQLHGVMCDMPYMQLSCPHVLVPSGGGNTKGRLLGKPHEHNLAR